MKEGERVAHNTSDFAANVFFLEEMLLDFTALKLGRPHHMLFGSTKMGNKNVALK